MQGIFLDSYSGGSVWEIFAFRGCGWRASAVTLMVWVKDTATCPRLTFVSRLPRVWTTAKGSTLMICQTNKSRSHKLRGMYHAAIEKIECNILLEVMDSMVQPAKKCRERPSLSQWLGEDRTRSLSIFGFSCKFSVHIVRANADPTANCIHL